MTKAILKKKKCKKAKLFSEVAIQIAEERKEEKGKGERERYTQMNVEFQTIMRRNKKAFLSEQCKELEENSRMRKTRSPQESWRYQGNISFKDGHNKGRKQYRPNGSRGD